jgi:hypothetical protein
MKFVCVLTNAGRCVLMFIEKYFNYSIHAHTLILFSVYSFVFDRYYFRFICFVYFLVSGFYSHFASCVLTLNTVYVSRRTFCALPHIVCIELTLCVGKMCPVVSE